MIFTATKLDGAFIIDIQKLEDDRGFFARSFCQREFQEYGLNPNLAQCNISYNRKKGTLRGMHFQAAPFQEAKLVRCTHGAIYDVIIDLRINSFTYKKHVAFTLKANEHRMLYVPENFAHGFLTLEDNTQVFYQMSEFYVPGHDRGFRWDDPEFDIEWPDDIKVISERDSSYADFSTVL